MKPSAAAFNADAFNLLGECTNETQTLARLGGRVDRLIALLNQTQGCARIAETRAQFRARRVEALFQDRPLGGVDYVRASRAHWYIYHRGGRWEPQFNVGMFGEPVGGRRYLRFGVGFCLNLNSQDPDRHARLTDLYSLFQGFLRLVRSPGRAEFQWLLSNQRRLTVERDGAGPDLTLKTPNQAIDWLLSWQQPSGWLFIGDRLDPEYRDDAAVLEDWSRLTLTIAQSFSAWLPTWSRIWAVAGR